MPSRCAVREAIKSHYLTEKQKENSFRVKGLGSKSLHMVPVELMRFVWTLNLGDIPNRLFTFHWDLGYRNGNMISQVPVAAVVEGVCATDARSVQRAYRVLSKHGLILRIPVRDENNKWKNAPSITVITVPDDVLTELEALPDRGTPRHQGQNNSTRDHQGIALTQQGPRPLSTSYSASPASTEGAVELAVANQEHRQPAHAVLRGQEQDDLAQIEITAELTQVNPQTGDQDQDWVPNTDPDDGHGQMDGQTLIPVAAFHQAQPPVSQNVSHETGAAIPTTRPRNPMERLAKVQARAQARPSQVQQRQEVKTDSCQVRNPLQSRQIHPKPVATTPRPLQGQVQVKADADRVEQDQGSKTPLERELARLLQRKADLNQRLQGHITPDERLDVMEEFGPVITQIDRLKEKLGTDRVEQERHQPQPHQDQPAVQAAHSAIQQAGPTHQQNPTSRPVEPAPPRTTKNTTGRPFRHPAAILEGLQDRHEGESRAKLKEDRRPPNVTGTPYIKESESTIAGQGKPVVEQPVADQSSLQQPLDHNRPIRASGTTSADSGSPPKRRIGPSRFAMILERVKSISGISNPRELAEEILWSVEEGVQRGRTELHAINAAFKLVRENRWRTPYGFAQATGRVNPQAAEGQGRGVLQ